MRYYGIRLISLLLVLCMLLWVPVSASELNWAQKLVGLQTAVDQDITGEGVVIGLIDSGLSQSYAETLNVIQGTNYLVTESSPDRHNTSDNVGHGTNVASILADPVLGLVPDATLVPLKCFDSSSGSYAPIIEALYDAVDVYHCDVVNMSLGGTSNNAKLAAAVQYALDHGVILIAAAGNISSGSTGNDRYYYPASYDGVISVGAVSSSSIVSNTSVQNDRVWITAPGKYVPVYSKSGAYSTNSGTSIASPFVAAAAAMALSVAPEITPEDFATLLRHTVQDLGAEGHDNSYGHGLLDLDALLSAVIDSQLQLFHTDDGTVSGYCRPEIPVEVYHLSLVFYDADGRFVGMQQRTVPGNLDVFSDIPLPTGCADVKCFVTDVTFSPLQQAAYIKTTPS